MSIAKYLAALAVLSLASAPSLAVSAPATSLSISKAVRASGSTKKSNKLAGTGLIIALVASAAVVAGVVVVATDKSDSG